MMEKLTPDDGLTPDRVAQNIEKLKELFPEVVVDGAINFDALKQTLGSYADEHEERYSFTWHGKSRARRIAQEPSSATLLPCKQESVHWDTTQNLFIEGDNLEVLKLLQKSYHRQVKTIYIDPPYNTGKAFIYPDKFQDNLDTYLKYTGQMDDAGVKRSATTETAGRYHTNWLNMMYPRLTLARNLLRDDGVIFVSIDEHELANLKLVCDEVFGEEKFIAIFKWNKTSKAPSLSKRIRTKYEYVLCYGMSPDIQLRGPASYNVAAPLFNSGNLPSRRDFAPGDLRFEFDDGPYAAGTYGDGEKAVTLHHDLVVKDGRNADLLGITGRFKWTQKTIEERLQDGQELFFKTPTFTTLYYSLSPDSDKFIAPSDLLNKEECGVLRNDQGHSELKALFNNRVIFDYPKPLSLPRKLVEMANDKDGITLDFFAGSGSTAHAVMDLNAEDNGQRRFIMVQLPELTAETSEAHKADLHTIAEIGKERIRRAGAAIAAAHPAVDTGFRVFKLASSNMTAWDTELGVVQEDRANDREPIKAERSAEDVLYELLLKYGRDLAMAVDERTIGGKTVFTIGGGALVICLDDGVTLDVVRGIAALKAELKPEEMRVVFKDAGFEDDGVQSNAVQVLQQAGVDDVKSL